MNVTSRITCAVLVLAALGASTPATAQRRRPPVDPAATERLLAATGGRARVSIDETTGRARFVAIPPGSEVVATVQAPDRGTPVARAAAFLKAHGQVFGIRDVDIELRVADVRTDRLGRARVAYQQVYQGVPVFAGVVMSHFDQGNDLRAVNGRFVADIEVSPVPTVSEHSAAQTAAAKVNADAAPRIPSEPGTPRLYVYREGLAKGVQGPDHLVWEVEVTNGHDVREFVYVSAHTGKIVDQITGIYDAKHRRAYDADGATAPGLNYPTAPFWVEGNTFPTGVPEADNMIAASGETYDVFSRAFGRDSFDAAGGIMDSIFNRGNGCPNASWNGLFISFCPGTTSDDVTAHEWGHAYTQYTHNLIYQWQPGALNESYSDIWGEVVDFVNGRGTDTPGGPRTADSCSTFTTLAPKVTVNAPAAIAGQKLTGTAAFGPQAFSLTSDAVLANDGDPTPSDGCCAGPSFVCAPNSWTNAAQVLGKIAIVDRGTCGFAVKVKNAQVNGAVGVIVANNTGGILNMGGVDPNVTIPSLSILQSDGAAIKAQLLSTPVNVTLSRGAKGTENSVRWLMGEDATAFGGAIRDMWNPTCYSNPGKVTDTAYYVCSTGDGGGVHTNSGVPNHAFALLVDGGTYNGQTVGSIGLTKAAHVYYRAQTVYQHPAADFADHADAIEQSCTDLIGQNLASLETGAPSGEAITAGDCAQVAKAALAVELRTPPAFCHFVPVLAKAAPPVCAPGKQPKILFRDGFEAGAASTARWTISREGVTADFTPRDWQVVPNLPDRTGRAFFGPDPNIGTCAPGGDESGVLVLVSPQIVIDEKTPGALLAFDHWVATEAGWDGGNLKISVNGGPWLLIGAADFVYNPYNATLFTAAQGNTNPLAGEPAFSGTDGGSVEGSWGRSIVNLAPYVRQKDKVRLRFDIGTDACSGAFGWYVDDVTVLTCR